MKLAAPPPRYRSAEAYRKQRERAAALTMTRVWLYGSARRTEAVTAPLDADDAVAAAERILAGGR